MSLTVDCKNLKGKVTVPYSKSMAHRYLLASFLSGNYDAVKDFDDTNMSLDIYATQNCLEKIILGTNPVKLNCGESGTTLRFIVSLVAVLGIEAEIETSGTLVARPMEELISQLEKNEASVGVNKAKDKIIYTLAGKLRAGEYHLPANKSSQYISSLLFALPLLDGDSKILIDGELESKPYVDLTLHTLDLFGVGVKVKEKQYKIPGNQKYVYQNTAKSLLEGDWSAGAMWLVANSILNSVEVLGLDEESLQADAFIQDILEIDDDLDVIVSAMDCPDLVPAIALWALPRNGKTTITDLKRMQYKESNRLSALQEIINQIGGNAEAIDDNLVIVGTNKTPLKAPKNPINTYNDHRMVMFASLVSILTDGPITIDSPESVKKSYPIFFDELLQLGGNLKWN